MDRRAVFLPYRPKTILNRRKRPDFWFWSRYSAYPYIGCQHGCAFCYCREKKYSPFDDPEDFSRVIKVKSNAADLLRRELKGQPVDPVFTGDYQAAERRFGLSREMLQVCLEIGFPVFILERSPLVLRDMDLISAIHNYSRATVAFSIISTLDSPGYTAAAQIERLAPAVEKRFAAMAAFAKAGIPTGTCFMPALPGICDDPKTIENVVRWTADHGGSFVLASTLTLADQQRDHFMAYLAENLPEKVEFYQQLYPAGSYGPAGIPEIAGLNWGPNGSYPEIGDGLGIRIHGSAWKRLGLRVREACNKYGIRDRQPRPIISGEKRALNKRIVEALADDLYTLELEGAAPAQQWPVRTAAWAIEDLPQDIGLVYRTLGERGLASIPGLSAELAGRIQSILRDFDNNGLDNRPGILSS